MGSPGTRSSSEIAKEAYRQALLYIFKMVVFTLAVAGWLIGLLKKCAK
jgi:hypothetical protein